MICINIIIVPTHCYHLCLILITSMAPQFTEDSSAAKKLFQLFDCFANDPTRGVDACNTTSDYIKSTVYPKEPEFKEIDIKIFYPRYRRFAEKWSVNSRVSGQRVARAPKRQRGT